MKKKPGLLKIATLVIMLAMVAGLAVVLFMYDIREMVQVLGIRNSYLIAFLFSIVGAYTNMTKITTYPLVVALALGHSQPLLVGLFAGLGLAVGDILFYYMGFTAREMTGGKTRARLEKLLARLKRQSMVVVQAFIFLYVAFSPFPNNLLTGALAFTGYPFVRVLVPLVLGDLTLPVVIALLVSRGII